MPAPLTTARNQYRDNEKRHDIFTPPALAEFLAEILSPIVSERIEQGCNVIVDPAVGSGRLLYPFKRRFGTKVITVGYDIVDQETHGVDYFNNWNFLNGKILHETYAQGYQDRTALVIANFPFNNTQESRSFLKSLGKGNALLPEVFLDRIWELYGTDVPVAAIVPMGLRLNQRVHSARWRKMRDTYPKITSIVSLPLNIFEGVEFHCEIVVFNAPGLDAHYFLPEEAVLSG